MPARKGRSSYWCQWRGLPMGILRQDHHSYGDDAMTSCGDDRPDEAHAPSRRDVVGGAAAAITLAAMPTGHALAAEGSSMVSGTVYEARSGANHRQANDLGIAGVLVSNG